MTNPSLPIKLGGYYTDGNSKALDVLGDYAYVLTVNSGLIVINITDPTHLVLSGSLNGIGYGSIDHSGVGSITVSGDYAYIARGDQGLAIVNIANPSTPYVAGTYGVGSAISDVKVVGNYAYLADSHDGLKILDITNPALPILLGVYDSLGGFTELAIVGNYVYTINWHWTSGSKGLNIIDISNPSLPTLKGSYSTNSFAEVSIVGNYAYLLDLHVNLFVVDISNPESPSYLSYLNDPEGRYAPSMSIAGNYLYSVDSQNSILETINITDPSTPVLEHVYKSVQDGFRAINIVNNYAYTASYDNFKILDISNPILPNTVGELNATVENDAYMTALDILRDYAYIIENNDDVNSSRLRIVNISNSILPIEEAYLDINVKYTKKIQVHNGYAYITAGQEGLRIVDINNSTSPNLVASYDTLDGFMSGIDTVGNYAYVADGYNGLHILDITNPLLPVLVSQYVSRRFINTVTISGNYAYVGTNVGLEIIDITNLQSPQYVSSINIPGCFGIGDIEILNNYVYGQGIGNLLSVIDVSNHFQPMTKRQFKMVNIVGQVALAGNYAYSADSEGLIINKVYV